MERLLATIMNNNRGSALIESLVMVSTGILVLTLGLSTMAIGISKLWLEHVLYKRLLCELKSSTHCDEVFHKSTSLIPWGRLASHKISKTGNRKKYQTVTGELEWCLFKPKSPAEKCNLLNLNMTIKEIQFRDLRL